MTVAYFLVYVQVLTKDMDMYLGVSSSHFVSYIHAQMTLLSAQTYYQQSITAHVAAPKEIEPYTTDLAKG